MTRQTDDIGLGVALGVVALCLTVVLALAVYSGRAPSGPTQPNVVPALQLNLPAHPTPAAASEAVTPAQAATTATLEGV